MQYIYTNDPAQYKQLLCECNKDNKPMLFSTFSCWSHVGDIKLSESYSKYETNIFNL